MTEDLTHTTPRDVTYSKYKKVSPGRKNVRSRDDPLRRDIVAWAGVSGVYGVHNLKNNIISIGYTTNVGLRLYQILRGLCRNEHWNKDLQRAWNTSVARNLPLERLWDFRGEQRVAEASYDNLQHAVRLVAAAYEKKGARFYNARQKSGLGGQELGEYSIQIKIEAADLLYKQSYLFLSSCCINRSWEDTGARELYTHFSCWCQSKGLRPDTPQDFMDALFLLGYRVRPLPPGADPQEAIWVGIAYLSPMEYTAFRERE